MSCGKKKAAINFGKNFGIDVLVIISIFGDTSVSRLSDCACEPNRKSGKKDFKIFLCQREVEQATRRGVVSTRGEWRGEVVCLE